LTNTASLLVAAASMCAARWQARHVRMAGKPPQTYRNLHLGLSRTSSYLASIDADACARLTTFPVVFHRKQKSFERIVESPIVTMGAPLGFIVRYSYFTLAPFKYPFAHMEAWYRAYDRFAKIVRDKRHQYRFYLQPDDFVLYDNHRMLHGRTAFSGPRWVRGIYFDETK
jgi:gamma-butyrobetaine dioxygenase